MKKLIQSLFLIVFIAFNATAQERTVTGIVTAREDGLPLPGVNIKVNNAAIGTTTGANGRYSLSVPASATQLVFTYIGYLPQTITIGSSNVVNVVLTVDAQLLGEVVITALGIERQKREIGYATTTVTNKVVNQAAPVNIANGLQGKVSGLNITTVNNGVFEDVKINLRGIRSLTGNNNPMLLLDGVPASLGYLSSLNPNDLENVTVLKGSSAAAIYGPDARNGVIVVTTKKSSDTPVITAGHSTQFSQISFFPKFQNQFGSGGYNEYTAYENWSWGPAFDGSTVEIGHTLPDGSVQTVPYVALENERKDFFNTGVTMQNDLSFAAKDFYISVQDAIIKGIVPDDKNRRTGIRLNTAREYGKFRVGFNNNYVQQDYNVFDDNAMETYHVNSGVGLNGGLMNLIFNTPAHIPITSYKDFNGNKFATYNNYFNDYGLNPYFALDNWREDGKSSDLLSNLELSFKAADWMSLNYRAGLTLNNLNGRRSSRAEVPNQYGLDRGFALIPGAIEERSYKNSRLSSEVFANLNHTINENFKVNGVVGSYVRQNHIRDTKVGAANLVVPELFNVANRTGELSGSSPESRTRLFSVYASAGVSYKGWANLEVTGRNDRTSVLGLNNNSFFYPGVSGSLVLSDALSFLKENKFLSYLKLRASWNKTGNADIAAYLLAATFSQPAGFPFGSLPGYTANNTTYDANLEPEFIESREVGLESSFFNNRLNVEATYYNQQNDNQIIPISVSSSTGYTSAYVNAAAFLNKGVELDLRLTPLVNLGSVNIELRTNASYNNSEITSVYEGLNELSIGGYTNAGNYAVVGQPAFVIKSTDYLRDPQGRVIVNATTGYPSADPSLKQYGRTMPSWIVGINPSVNWKGLNLSVLGEYKGGHYAYHEIGGAMAWTGVSAITAQNNRERFVFPNSSYADPANPGNYVANTSVTVSNVNDFYTGTYRTAASNFITSAAAWRLREVSLGYQIPAKWIASQKAIKSINLALTGRNLFLWVPKSNVYQDPDFNFATTGNTAGITNSQINPPVRTFGANVSLRF
jgi:TonB-linked SusC/RagA family outer membrane protein